MNNRSASANYQNWVDCAKLIGLYLMVLGHGLVSNRQTQFIYSFHMALFFVLSGYLYKKRDLNSTLKKGIKSLLIPYLLLNSIGVLYDIIEKHLVGKSLSFLDVIHRIGAVLMGLGYDYDGWHPVLSATWYIYTLLIIQIVCALCYNKRFWYIFLTIPVCLFLILNSNDIDTLIPIDSALLAFPFFVFGTLLQNRNVPKLSNAWGG